MEKSFVDWPGLEYELDDPYLKDMRNEISITDSTLQEILRLHFSDVWREILDKKLYRKRLNLNELLDRIRRHFNESEFRDLCFGLDIDYGSLGGDHYYDRARELVSQCKRSGCLGELLNLCRCKRPQIIWGYDDAQNNDG